MNDTIFKDLTSSALLVLVRIKEAVNSRKPNASLHPIARIPLLFRHRLIFVISTIYRSRQRPRNIWRYRLLQSLFFLPLLPLYIFIMPGL